ncbi:MAG TPA: gluconate 2-dehydrogenase subunit 3 family protein [Saprospiraceae bacterium]|nr:gluconate 2-dehydrogenase subunit 3 family protein [Saprospiraceae bacterium]HMQ85785.1 gluconate 2-dehydrogenase subunit 3 family protein [Saprospiraceae bacterium]
MDRRESLKNLLAGAAITSALFTQLSCERAPDHEESAAASPSDFPFEGTRTQEEQRRDARMHATDFFLESEKQTLTTLSDLILPEDGKGPAASKTGVVDFIEFMALDFPDFQVPLRAGLAWLSAESLERFENNDFSALQPAQQKQLLDEIAYLPDDPMEELTAPVAFFDLVRGLVLTGYFTSKEGVADLGYKGNMANIWDGVPQEVLAKHDIEYDPAWEAKCINQDTRETLAEWDENGKLLN